MKLKNKKTGEIREVSNILIDGMFTVNSLAELCEEWEDYEEPKELYFVDARQECHIGILNIEEDPKWCARLIELGLGFYTYEEAEKAVDKLKAWKRLNEAGLKIEAENVSDIDSIKDGYVDFDLHCYFKWYYGFGEDMDTLFSQEDD